jgi:MinD superfamily P-loop ATPase
MSADSASTRTQHGVRQLVVLSGKGGTGKTTVAAALASLATDKILADCDVDAADLQLLLAPNVRSEETFVAGKEARILAARCSACGQCAEHCRFEAIHTTQSETGRIVYAVDPVACEGCGHCARVCSSNAVDMVAAERGRWFVSDTRLGPLVHAQLNIGGENSGKLVTLVRNEASRLAEVHGAGLVIVDGPPGIGCPVIASVTGADLVLAVTEPTVSGEHDLKRAAGLVQGFGLPLAVCINKADLNEQMRDRIREFCTSRGCPVVGELDYDPRVVQAQVEAQTIIEYGDSVVVHQIEEMWANLETILAKVKESK